MFGHIVSPQLQYESTLVVGDYSGLPFLDGMMFNKAGDATALADTILSPKESINKTIYVSTVYNFSGNGKWYFWGHMYLKITA